MRPVQVFLHEVVPDGLLAGVAEYGDGVRVVRRDRDLAVTARRMGLHEILGQAFEVRGPHMDGADVLADRLVKLLADRGDLVAQPLHASARRIVAVDARQVEISEDLLERETGGRVLAGNVERREGIVHLAVQAQFRGEPVGLLIRLVSGLTHRGVRMHIEEELRLGEELFEPTRQLVERLEGVLYRPRPLRFPDSLQEGAALREVGLKPALEFRGGLREQQLRRGESTGSALRFRHGAPRGQSRARGFEPSRSNRGSGSASIAPEGPNVFHSRPRWTARWPTPSCGRATCGRATMAARTSSGAWTLTWRRRRRSSSSDRTAAARPRSFRSWAASTCRAEGP